MLVESKMSVVLNKKNPLNKITTVEMIHRVPEKDDDSFHERRLKNKN